MGLLARVGRWLARPFRPKPPRAPSPPRGPRGPRKPPPPAPPGGPPPGEGLPDGWRVAGLFRQGEGTTDVRGSRVTNGQIAHADAIIVEYDGPEYAEPVFRHVHGARDLRGLADLIERETAISSPPSAGRTR